MLKLKSSLLYVNFVYVIRAYKAQHWGPHWAGKGLNKPKLGQKSLIYAQIRPEKGQIGSIKAQKSSNHANQAQSGLIKVKIGQIAQIYLDPVRDLLTDGRVDGRTNISLSILRQNLRTTYCLKPQFDCKSLQMAWGTVP